MKIKTYLISCKKANSNEREFQLFYQVCEYW